MSHNNLILNLKNELYIIKKKIIKYYKYIYINNKKKIIIKNKNNNLINSSFKLILLIWKTEIKTLNLLKFKIQEIQLLLKLTEKYNDNSLLKNLLLSIKMINNELENLNKQALLFKPQDKYNCFLEIHYGTGGVDAQDWAYILFKMYINWAINNNFKILIINKTKGDKIGIKTATIKIIGKYAYGFLFSEIGIHRLIRYTPFKTIKKRHTSFCSIEVYPELNTYINTIKIDKKDIRIDVFKSSGAGGQHVNTTESAIRIVHLPTGIITQSQMSRSQHENKKQALKQLISKLTVKLNNKTTNTKQNKQNITWGNQIRSYILDISIIKDNRTGIISKDINKILNGKIDIFLKKYLQLRLFNYVTQFN